MTPCKQDVVTPQVSTLFPKVLFTKVKMINVLKNLICWILIVNHDRLLSYIHDLYRSLKVDYFLCSLLIGHVLSCFFGIVGKLFSKCVFRNLHYELALSFFYDCRLNYGFSFSRIVYLGLTFNTWTCHLTPLTIPLEVIPLAMLVIRWGKIRIYLKKVYYFKELWTN